MPVNSNLQLSIILPIYNVAPYVEKCIRSLEDQDIPKDTYEIICVNDGSPDNSQQIVEKLQQEFSNIILINQKNQGVSVARNVGIEKARGNTFSLWILMTPYRPIVWFVASLYSKE